MKSSVYALALLVLAGCGSGDGPQKANDFRVDNPYDGLWQDSPEVPFRFVLEQAFGAEEEPEEAILGSIFGATSDDAGNVYFFDFQQSSVISFDRDGNFRWSAGGAGQGPGELNFAGPPMWNGRDRLFVSNQGGRRVEIFDTTGQFIETRSVDALGLESAGVDGFLSPSRLVLSQGESGRVGADIHIVSIDPGWQLESTISIDLVLKDNPPRPITRKPSLAVLDEGIVVSHVDRYQFDIYTPNGTLNRIVTRAMDGIVRPIVTPRGSIANYSTLYAPFEVSDAYRLVTATWPKDFPDPKEIESSGSIEGLRDLTYLSTIDLYNENWRLLYAWTVERGGHGEIGRLLHTDGNGRVYAAITGGNGTVGRFRLEVTPPN